MIGDVLLLAEKHQWAARKMEERLREYRVGKLVVAIAGESGSGKSELAHALARRLKDELRPAKILHLDDYFRIPPAERTAWRQRHGLAAVGDEEIDWPRVERHVAAFRRGERATLPSIDLLTDQVDELTTDFAGIPVLIVEGLYALRAPADVRVLIDLTYHETRKAQLLRGKEPQTVFRAQVLEREHQVVQSLRHLADWWVTRELDVIDVEPPEAALEAVG
jgi:uridine kinase